MIIQTTNSFDLTPANARMVVKSGLIDNASDEVKQTIIETSKQGLFNPELVVNPLFKPNPNELEFIQFLIDRNFRCYVNLNTKPYGDFRYIQCIYEAAIHTNTKITSIADPLPMMFKREGLDYKDIAPTGTEFSGYVIRMGYQNYRDYHNMYNKSCLIIDTSNSKLNLGIFRDSLRESLKITREVDTDVIDDFVNDTRKLSLLGYYFA